MSRIRIVKKNDEYTSEYQVGDLFEITGTWYGGVHIMGKSGAPVSLDKEEYVELDTEPELKQEEVIPRDIRVGDIVQHFKREWVSGETSEYLYKVLAFAQHTETGEKEGVKAAEQEKPKKRRNRKKNRKNEMRKSYFAGMISMLAIVMIVLVGTTFLWPGSSADHPGGFWSWRKTAAIKAMINPLQKRAA